MLAIFEGRWIGLAVARMKYGDEADWWWGGQQSAGRPSLTSLNSAVSHLD